MVLQHNQLRDVFVDFCHKANLGVRIEAGSALTPDLSRSCPAEVIIIVIINVHLLLFMYCFIQYYYFLKNNNNNLKNNRKKHPFRKRHGTLQG